MQRFRFDYESKRSLQALPSHLYKGLCIALNVIIKKSPSFYDPIPSLSLGQLTVT